MRSVQLPFHEPAAIRYMLSSGRQQKLAQMVAALLNLPAQLQMTKREVFLRKAQIKRYKMKCIPKKYFPARVC